MNPVNMHITVSAYWCPCEDGGLILAVKPIDMNSMGGMLGENVFLSNLYFWVLYKLHLAQCLQYLRMSFFIPHQ